MIRVLGLSIFLFVQILSTIALAAGSDLENKPNGAFCRDELKYCSYVAKNITGSELVNRINNSVFQGIPLTGSEDGYLTTESYGTAKIVFWHTTEDIRQQIIAMIPLLDRNEEFVPKAMVQVSAEIYALEERGMTNLKASLDSVSLSPFPGLDQGVTSDGNDLKLKFNIGSVGLATSLRASRVRQELETVTRFYSAVTNFETLKYANYVPVFYQFPGTTTGAKEYHAGLELTGQVSVSQEDPTLVMLRNGTVSFGIAAPEGDRVTTFLDLSLNNVVFKKGVAAVLVSTNTTLNFKKKSGGLLHIGHDSEKAATSLVVILSLRPISYEDYQSELDYLSKVNQVHPVVDPEKVAELPVRGGLEDIFHSLTPRAISRPDGTVLLGFTLKKDLMSQENFQRRVRIRIKGKGIGKVEEVRQVQNMALGWFSFPNLKLQELQGKADVKFSVELLERHPENSSGKVSVKHTLYYNPVTNDFYKL